LRVDSAFRSFGFPSFQGDILNLDFFQNFEVGREVRDFRPLMKIFDSDFDFREVIQDIKFRKIERGVSVDLS
jgi:hypothetical protein